VRDNPILLEDMASPVEAERAPTEFTKPVAKALAARANRNFFRGLYDLPPQATKSERKLALNRATKLQLQLMIHVLHHVMSGAIPIPKDLGNGIVKSGKINFLNHHFRSQKSVARLLSLPEDEQRLVLVQVNNYHALFHSLFNR
jgi:hypothetical protein